MKKICILTIIIVILSSILTGCGREPNEIAYIVALGIDNADEGNYKITIQYANTTQISGGGGEEGGKAGTEIMDNIVVEGPDIYAAIGLANNIVSKIFSMSHAKLIVFSDEIAKSGIENIIETIKRSEELRPDIFFAVAQGGANEYLTSVKPEMEVNPAQYYQLIFGKNHFTGVPNDTAVQFFFGITSDDYDSIIPVAGVIKESDDSSNSESQNGDENQKENEAPINKGKFEYNLRNYIGGETAIEKENKGEVIGSAVFDGDKMVGILGGIETEIYSIIKGDYSYSYLTFYNEKTPDVPITVKMTPRKKSKFDIDIENKKIDIEIFSEGDLYSLAFDYNVENDVENFEKKIEDDITAACTKFLNEFNAKYNSDIFGFKEKSKSKFLTNEEYEKFKNEVNFDEFTINVKTDFKLRRTGLVIREDNQ